MVASKKFNHATKVKSVYKLLLVCFFLAVALFFTELQVTTNTTKTTW